MTEHQVGAVVECLYEAEAQLDKAVNSFTETTGTQCDTCGGVSYTIHEKEIHRIRGGMEEALKKIDKWITKLEDPDNAINREEG
tara:strand:- start:666 stop:917 length:252 start_codon:yes stop_codon:yes gene_type:complete